MNLGRESEIIEFKKSTSELKDSMLDVASMLNKHGKGALYFGVKPNGDVCGQDIGFKTLDDIATMIKNAIKPMIYPSIEEVNIEDKTIIKVSFEGTEKPYSCFGRYYKRVFDRTEEMTPQELKHMMLNTDFTSIWENNLTNYSLETIDHQALKSFYDRSVSCGRLEPLDKYDEKELLIALGLYRDEKLTNAGYYLFSSNKPVVLKMAVYLTDVRINFADINRVENNIFNLIDIAILYIKEHINWSVSFDNNSAARIETPEISIEAIREIVVNSFAHANYRSYTEHQIVITPTLLEIYNPGEFPANYKPEDFVENRISSIPRNSNILNILYKSKNVEIQGSGLRKVFKICKSNNTNINYSINDYGFKFIFYRKNVTINVTENVTVNINKTDLEILRLLAENPTLSREVLASQINKTVRTVQRSLDKLRLVNKIRRIGSDRQGYWEIIK